MLLQYRSKFLVGIVIFLNLNVFAQSIDLDKQLGAENAKMVSAQMGIYEDEAKTEYVRQVGNRLLANLDKKVFDYQFHIVPAVEPNAFALPGGYIYITTGLLPIIQTEDELACIMAHEIIHAHKRHTIRQLKKSLLPRLFEIPGNLVGVLNEDLGNALNAPIRTSNALLMASYGRDHETESDIEGIKLAAAAGYDPSAMIPVLSRMSAAIENATGQSESKSYFNDHPYTPDRVATIKKNSDKITWSEKKPIAKSFLMAFDSLLFGESPSVGVIRDQQFLHPDLNFTLEFPKDWDIDNQPSAIGAYNPERSAAVFLSFEDPKLSPQEAANQFLKNLKPEYKEKLAGAEQFEINGQRGFLVSFEDSNYSEPVYAYILYLPMDGKLFKLTGITTNNYKTQLEKTAASLRKLTNEEKESFKIHLVRVVKAEKGETISALSKRVNNRLVAELTAIINAHSEKDELTRNEEIKVVKQYRYQTNHTN